MRAATEFQTLSCRIGAVIAAAAAGKESKDEMGRGGSLPLVFFFL